MPTIDPEAVKRDSEAIIRRAGGDICDWLPFLDRDAKPRQLDAVVRRALILNAMLQIYFKAPVAVIKDWITRNGWPTISRNRSVGFSTRTMRI